MVKTVVQISFVLNMLVVNQGKVPASSQETVAQTSSEYSSNLFAQDPTPASSVVGSPLGVTLGAGVSCENPYSYWYYH